MHKFFKGKFLHVQFIYPDNFPFYNFFSFSFSSPNLQLQPSSSGGGLGAVDPESHNLVFTTHFRIF